MNLKIFQYNQLDRYIKEPAGLGGMSPPQKRFHKDQASKRLFRAGNQIGKTRSGAAEAWWHALGNHPFRETPPAPNTGWVLCSDLRNGWPTLSQKLREIEPPGVVDPECRYDSARGYYYRGVRGLKLVNGSLIIGKGSDQSTIAMASGTVDWQWVDELPKPQHFSEFRTRGAVRNAPLWLTLTPIGRSAEWLKRLIDGDDYAGTGPEEEGWSSHVVPLKPENAPHRSLKDIAAQIAAMPSWERSIRCEAGWDSITISRRVPGFSKERNTFDQSEEHPLNDLTSIGIGCDWGITVGNTVFILVGYAETSKILYVLGEYTPTDRMTPREECAAVQENLLAEWGLNFFQVEHFRGDSNSAGRRSVAASCNNLFERAVAEHHGKSQAIFNCRSPYKGRGSVLARARMLSSSALEGKLMVHQSCQRVIASLQHWDGSTSTEKLKHSYDALAYVSDVYLGLDRSRGDKMQFTIVR